MDGNGQDPIVYFHLTITRDGSLTKWTFTAEDLGMERTGYPLLIILNVITLDLVIVNGSTALTIYPNVYEVTIDPPLPVEDGDFISLVLPSVTTARLLLTFILTGSPPGLSLDTAEEFDGLPLITLEIGMPYKYNYRAMLV